MLSPVFSLETQPEIAAESPVTMPAPPFWRIVQSRKTVLMPVEIPLFMLKRAVQALMAQLSDTVIPLPLLDSVTILRMTQLP